MRFRTVALALVVVMVLAAVAFAAGQDITKLLPAKNDVKGWQPMAGSLMYGKGRDIEDIYDGGAMELEKMGVTEAAQQLYQSSDKKLLMEIIVNKVKTPKAAKALYESQRKKLQATQRIKVSGGEIFLVKKPAQGYVVVGSYVASAVPTYENKKALDDTTAFLKVIAKKLKSAK